MKRLIEKLGFLGLLLSPIAQCSEMEDSTDNHEPDKPRIVDWHAFEHVGAQDFDQAMESRPYNLVACELLLITWFDSLLTLSSHSCTSTVKKHLNNNN